MRESFIQVNGEDFVLNGKKYVLKGFSIGSWMNLEHFMIGMPGTEEMIHEAFSDVYGAENSKEFFGKFVDDFITDGDMKYLSSMGINSVRLPFNYHWFMSDDAPGCWKKDGFDKLDRVISLCRKYHIFAILDLHSTPGGQNPDWHSDNPTGQPLFWKYRSFQDQMTELWRELAKHYKNEEWIAGYDILNEPSYGLTTEEFNRFYDVTTAAIRENDKDHVIFLEGDDFGRSFELFHEPQDEQTAYALHYYPFVIDGDVLDPSMPEEKRRAFFEKIFTRQLRARERFHRPLWCGEAGLEFQPEQAELYDTMLGYILELCEEHNVSWSLWTYKDARVMGVVVPKENSSWMRLKNTIGEKWGHHRETANSTETLRLACDKYFEPLTDDDFYDAEFRMRSLFHRLAVETILKKELRKISWDEIKTYPEDFLFENCEKFDFVTDCIRKHISGGI